MSTSQKFKIKYRKEIRDRKEAITNIVKFAQLLDHLEKYPNYSRYHQRHANYTQSIEYYQQQVDDITARLQDTADRLGTEWDLVLQRQIKKMDSSMPTSVVARLEDLNSLNNVMPMFHDSSKNTSKKPTKKALSAKSSSS